MTSGVHYVIHMSEPAICSIHLKLGIWRSNLTSHIRSTGAVICWMDQSVPRVDNGTTFDVVTSISQSINQTFIAPISAAKPGSAVRKRVMRSSSSRVNPTQPKIDVEPLHSIVALFSLLDSMPIVCPDYIYRSNFYTANIPGVARLSGATARSVFKCEVVEVVM